MKKVLFLITLALLSACAKLPDKATDAADLNAVLTDRARNESDEVIKTRLQKIKEALSQKPSIMRFQEAVAPEQTLAEDIALKDDRFTREAFDKEKNAPLFVEVFGIYPLLASDITEQTANCKNANCFRVESYNYAKNLTVNAVVNTDAKEVVVVTRMPQSAPNIPVSLRRLAEHIAMNAKEVADALGKKPSDPVMAGTQTALNRTRCERTQHLCVSPTFVEGEKALWAIVDLTELALVGVRWTNTGTTAQRPVSEKQIQNEFLTARYCEQAQSVEKKGWKMEYMLTNSDGLKIANVSYNGKPVISSAKLVDWHVNYSNSEGFGYSDAIGCPYFSESAVVAAVAPKIVERPDGFAIVQKFLSEGYPQPCNYSYEQRYEFFSDGRFRSVVGSLGRGCGNDGTYRPVTRIVFANGINQFKEWNGASFEPWKTEAWRLETNQTKLDGKGFQYEITDANGKGFALEPNKGKFGDNSRGDNAYVYVTRNDKAKDEGESDLVTIGPCCNTDHRQGPDKFIESQPESLENSEIVFWYVPQMKNDDRKGNEYCWAESVIENGVYSVKEYPCYSGAMFHPLN